MKVDGARCAPTDQKEIQDDPLDRQEAWYVGGRWKAAHQSLALTSGLVSGFRPNVLARCVLRMTPGKALASELAGATLSG